jgi:hypothetical protein
MTTVRCRRDDDLHGWLLEQAKALRLHKTDSIDWNELAEELDEIVALARKEAISRLRTVLSHLLKWRYQAAGRNETSWRITLNRERAELGLLLESRNLYNHIVDKGFERAYGDARREAGAEMQLERGAWDKLFPEKCEWDIQSALNPDFFPTIDNY